MPSTSTPASTLGARIQRAREIAGLNKNQLARAVGTSWQHVDHWERDRTLPTHASLQRLASVLDVSLAHLLGEDARAARAENDALETFLRSYAPDDLTPEEIAWLRAAPIDAHAASPGKYLDLLHRLRAPTVDPLPARRSEPAPPRTGRRPKVQLEEAALPRARAKRGA